MCIALISTSLTKICFNCYQKKLAKCSHEIQLETFRKLKGPMGYKQWEFNLAAVWGRCALEEGTQSFKKP